MRWRSHPLRALALRGLALVLPAVGGAGTAISLTRVLRYPEGLHRVLGWWVVVLGVSTLVAVGVDRLARRLVPLAWLLRLTLVFPDRAPSRFAVARAAGNTRILERRVREARERGLSDDLSTAAETVLSLVAALSAHDRRTRGHSERVRAFVDLLADEVKLPAEARDRLRWAALLHDIGKLQVAAEVLNKPGKLDDDEWAAIREHPAAGGRLAGPLMPWLDEWGKAIVEHHEWFDGSGYPRGSSGSGISVAGRIAAIADSFETMTAARAYKKPLTATAARRELARCAGSQFDPQLVRTFLNISIGRLVWVIGPMTWVAQIPVVGRIAWVGRETAAAAKSAALAKSLAGIVAVGVSATVAPPPAQAGAGGAPLRDRAVVLATSAREAFPAPEAAVEYPDEADAVRPGKEEKAGDDGEGRAPKPGGSGGDAGSEPEGGDPEETDSEESDPVGAVTETVSGTAEDIAGTVGSVADDVTEKVGVVSGSVPEADLDSLGL